MDISLFIAELLHQKDDVSVPYLGTFSRKRINGFYKHESDQFFPPSETLTFSSHSDENDILAEYISGQKNISLSSAKYFISKFVDELKGLLEASGHAELKNLGVIEKDAGEFKFTAITPNVFSGNYFGLSPVKEIRTEPLKDVKSAEYGAKAIIEDSLEFDEQEMYEDIPVKKTTKTSTKLMVALGLLISVAALVYIFNPETYQNLLEANTAKVERENPIGFNNNSASVPLATDSVDETLKDSSENVILPSVPSADSLKVSTQEYVENADLITFEIIGAAFGNRAEANDYVNVIASRGLYAKIVDRMPGAKVKVSLGSFTEKQEAEKELINIKKNLNKQAWIARVKPKKTKL